MLNLVNFNKEIKTLLIQSPSKSIEPNRIYDAKIVDENLTAKQVKTKKGDNLQIIEVLVAIEGHKPFKASLISESVEDFSKKSKNDDVKVFIKFDGQYTNAEI
jgi:hypothetical protein